MLEAGRSLELALAVLGALLGAVSLGPSAALLVAVFVCGLLVGERAGRGPAGSARCLCRPYRRWR